MHTDLCRAAVQAHIDDLERSAGARRIAADSAARRGGLFGRLKLELLAGRHRTSVQNSRSGADVTSVARARA
jgi:hypothetical protein